MKNKISDLRNHLFETIEMLKEGDAKMDIEKAKCIADLSQTVINSAKVEVDLLRHVGGVANSEFFEHSLAIEHQAPAKRLPNGGGH